MGLTSIFRSKASKAPKAAQAAPAPDAVQQARTRARRRLIGAFVLVVVGVLGFPLLFETQPRPVPVDIPIEIPKKDTAPPLAMPAARTRPIVTPVEPAASVAATPEVITESRADAGRDLPAADKPASHAAAPKPAETPAAKPAETAVAKPASSAAPVAAKPPPAAQTAAAEAARAQALLEGKAGEAKPPAKDSKEGARYIVQVGAFADAAAARETRSKVEKLGLKTYTQVADTAAGQRIRVRVGPFSSRDEADRAMAKARAAGVAAVVLTL
jgi:DedD protein